MKNVDNVFFSKFLNAEEKESVYNAGKMEDQRVLSLLTSTKQGDPLDIQFPHPFL